MEPLDFKRLLSRLTWTISIYSHVVWSKQYWCHLPTCYDCLHDMLHDLLTSTNDLAVKDLLLTLYLTSAKKPIGVLLA